MSASSVSGSGTAHVYTGNKTVTTDLRKLVTRDLRELVTRAQNQANLKPLFLNALILIRDNKFPKRNEDLDKLYLVPNYTKKLKFIDRIVNPDKVTHGALNNSEVKDKEAHNETWQEMAAREVREAVAKLQESSSQSNNTAPNPKAVESLVQPQKGFATVASARPVALQPAAAAARAPATSNQAAPAPAAPVQEARNQETRQQQRQVARANNYADSEDEGTRARQSASRKRYRASQKATRDRLKGELAEHKAELQAANERLAQAQKDYAQAQKDYSVNKLIWQREMANGKEAYTKLECQSKITISELRSKIVQLETQIVIFQHKEKTWAEQSSPTYGASATPSQSNHVEVEFYRGKLAIIGGELEKEKSARAALEEEKMRLVSDKGRLGIRFDALQEKHDKLKEKHEKLEWENEQLRRSQVAMQYQGFQAQQMLWYPAQYQYSDGEMDTSQMHYGQYMGSYHPGMNGMQPGMVGMPMTAQTMHPMMMGQDGHGHGYYMHGQMVANEPKDQNSQGVQPQET